MLRKSKEFPSSVEGTVRFEKETCCALEHGFERNPEAVRQLEEMMGKDKVRLFKEILSNTLNPSDRPEMKFVPTEEMKTVYGQIAKRELEELNKEKDESLSCDHTIEEHRRALEDVVRQVEPMAN